MSWFEQSTAVFALCGMIAITCCGQVLAQRPQPTQTDGSIAAMPLFQEIASCGQTFAQSPKPRQPYVHVPLPPKNSFAA